MKLVAGVVLLVACYRDADPPVQPTPAAAPKPAPAPTGYELLESKLAPVIADLPKLEAVVTTAECPKIAAALRAFGAAHGADIDDIGALRAKLTPEDTQELDDKHGADATRVRAVVESSMRSCGNDLDVIHALDVAGFRRKTPAP